MKSLVVESSGYLLDVAQSLTYYIALSLYPVSLHMIHKSYDIADVIKQKVLMLLSIFLFEV